MIEKYFTLSLMTNEQEIFLERGVPAPTDYNPLTCNEKLKSELNAFTCSGSLGINEYESLEGLSIALRPFLPVKNKERVESTTEVQPTSDNLILLEKARTLVMSTLCKNRVSLENSIMKEDITMDPSHHMSVYNTVIPEERNRLLAVNRHAVLANVPSQTMNTKDIFGVMRRIEFGHNGTTVFYTTYLMILFVLSYHQRKNIFLNRKILTLNNLLELLDSRHTVECASGDKFPLSLLCSEWKDQVMSVTQALHSIELDQFNFINYLTLMESRLAVLMFTENETDIMDVPEYRTATSKKGDFFVASRYMVQIGYCFSVSLRRILVDLDYVQAQKCNISAFIDDQTRQNVTNFLSKCCTILWGMGRLMKVLSTEIQNSYVTPPMIYMSRIQNKMRKPTAMTSLTSVMSSREKSHIMNLSTLRPNTLLYDSPPHVKLTLMFVLIEAHFKTLGLTTDFSFMTECVIPWGLRDLAEQKRRSLEPQVFFWNVGNRFFVCSGETVYDVGHDPVVLFLSFLILLERDSASRLKDISAQSLIEESVGYDKIHELSSRLY